MAWILRKLRVRINICCIDNHRLPSELAVPHDNFPPLRSGRGLERSRRPELVWACCLADGLLVLVEIAAHPRLVSRPLRDAGCGGSSISTTLSQAIIGRDSDEDSGPAKLVSC